MTARSRRRMGSRIKRILAAIPVDFGGGCSFRKGYVMAGLIAAGGARESVDIGVYRGRSLAPQAVAHLETGGVVHGIDPYSAEEARQVDRPDRFEEMERFRKQLDFDAVRQGVLDLVAREGLGPHVDMVRLPSQEAAARWDGAGRPFGLVHIDGNHDARVVSEDVRLYLPLLRPGGWLVLDDTSWDSVRPTFLRLAESMTVVHEVQDSQDDYAILLDARSRWEAWRGRRLVRRLLREAARLER